MIQKRSIIIFIFVALSCLLFLWLANSTSGEQAVMPEPLQVDEPQERRLVGETGGDSALILRDANLNKKLAERFRLTVGYIEKGQGERAIVELKEIIRQQPNAIEPYINLASIYAKANKIDQASETLVKAISVNRNTTVLFEGLQKVYAAQAALAYQRALEIDTVSEKDLVVDLPVIDTLMIDRPNSTEQSLISNNAGLQQQLDNNVAQLKSLRQSLAQALKEKNELVGSAPQVGGNENSLAQASSQDPTLVSQLQQAQFEIGELKEAHEKQLNELKVQSDQQVLALQRQLDLQTAMLADVNIESIKPIESVAAPSEPLSQPSVPSSQPSSIKPSENTSEDQKDTIAINLVKTWARSWAAQDVDTYVSHYEKNYRPSNGISNKKWREQRQVRLTNKSFINVDVKNFIVEDQDDQFSVTFSQHYQSNNVDDTITKRLVFKKNNDDWSKAKIVQEQVVSS